MVVLQEMDVQSVSIFFLPARFGKVKTRGGRSCATAVLPGERYLINCDNSYHLLHRLQQRGGVARDVVTEKYILGMRILMLGLNRPSRLGENRVRART
jgi:hypothetical protein